MMHIYNLRDLIIHMYIYVTFGKHRLVLYSKHYKHLVFVWHYRPIILESKTGYSWIQKQNA